MIRKYIRNVSDHITTSGATGYGTIIKRHQKLFSMIRNPFDLLDEKEGSKSAIRKYIRNVSDNCKKLNASHLRHESSKTHQKRKPYDQKPRPLKGARGFLIVIMAAAFRRAKPWAR